MNNLDIFRFLLQREVNSDSFKLADDVEDSTFQSNKVLEPSELNSLSPSERITCHDFEEPTSQYWIPDKVQYI